MSPYVSAASVTMAIPAFLVAMCVDYWRKTNAPLHEHLGRSAAAGGIPSAVILMYGAFDPSILSQIPGLNVPIAFGGMSLFYISIKAALKSPPGLPPPAITEQEDTRSGKPTRG